MKKWCLFFSIYICLCLLAACAAGTGTSEEPDGEEGDVPTEETTENQIVCRVISEADGSLLLAEQETGESIYTLSLEGKKLTLDGAEFDPEAPGAYQTLPAGALVGAMATVTYDGGIEESWPARLSGVTAVEFSTENFNDLCSLYLQVLEDLWEADNGLNGNITQLGVDLSGTRLTESEQAAVAWAFGQTHGIAPIEGTYEELVEQGYITGEPLGGDAPADVKFWQWEDGCLFSIEEGEEPVVFSLPAIGPGEEIPAYDAVRFDAQKWRSSLGAYFFSDCTAVSNGGGHWASYRVGSEMIS